MQSSVHDFTAACNAYPHLCHNTSASSKGEQQRARMSLTIPASGSPTVLTAYKQGVQGLYVHGKCPHSHSPDPLFTEAVPSNLSFADRSGNAPYFRSRIFSLSRRMQAINGLSFPRGRETGERCIISFMALLWLLIHLRPCRDCWSGLFVGKSVPGTYRIFFSIHGLGMGERPVS